MPTLMPKNVRKQKKFLVPAAAGPTKNVLFNVVASTPTMLAVGPRTKNIVLVLKSLDMLA